jgi:hypothetical protein
VEELLGYAECLHAKLEIARIPPLPLPALRASPDPAPERKLQSPDPSTLPPKTPAWQWEPARLQAHRGLSANTCLPALSDPASRPAASCASSRRGGRGASDAFAASRAVLAKGQSIFPFFPFAWQSCERHVETWKR